MVVDGVRDARKDDDENKEERGGGSDNTIDRAGGLTSITSFSPFRRPPSPGAECRDSEVSLTLSTSSFQTPTQSPNRGDCSPTIRSSAFANSSYRLDQTKNNSGYSTPYSPHLSSPSPKRFFGGLSWGGGEGKKDGLVGTRGEMVGNIKEPLLPLDQSQAQTQASEPRVSFNTRVSELTSDGEGGWRDLEGHGAVSSQSWSLLSPFPLLRKSSTFSNIRFIYIYIFLFLIFLISRFN